MSEYYLRDGFLFRFDLRQTVHVKRQGGKDHSYDRFQVGNRFDQEPANEKEVERGIHDFLIRERLITGVEFSER